MHADFQELLSLRAGAPVAADVALHVSKCPKCGLELGRLQRLAADLTQLPQFEPPQRVWFTIQEQLTEGAPRHARSHWVYVSAAAAAIIAVISAVLWSSTIHRDAAARTPTVAAETATPVLDPDSIGPLVQRSQELEAVLQKMPQRPMVERAATSATIDEIQSSIQMVDLRLSDGSQIDQQEATRLWNTRVQLLDSLVYVRYAEVARAARPLHTLETGAI
jgi:hypothetical protein